MRDEFYEPLDGTNSESDPKTGNGKKLQPEEASNKVSNVANTGIVINGTLGEIALHSSQTDSVDAKNMFREIVERELPPGYEFDHEAGLIRLPLSRTRAIRICSAIRLQAELRAQEGNGSVMQLRIEDRFGELREVLIERTALASDPKGVMQILLAVDFDIRCSPRELALFLLSQRTQRSGIAVRTPGWTILPGNKRFYVFPDAKVLPDTESPASVALVGPREAAGVTSGSVADWNTRVGTLLNENPSLIFAVSVALAGPLMRFAQHDAVGFNLYHATSAGKTHLLSAAEGVWRNPMNLHRGNATRTALELMCQQRNDGFLALDELPQGNPKDLKEIVMMIGNGTGHGRSTRDLTLRPTNRWRVALLSSSEQPASELMGERETQEPNGASVRMIDIPIGGWRFGAFANLHGRTDGHAFTRDLKKAVSENYGVIGPHFIEYLIAQDQNQLTNRVEQLIEKAKEQPIASLKINGSRITGLVNRCLQSFSLVATAGMLAAEAGLLSIPPEEIMNATINVVEKWGANRSRSISERIDEIQRQLGIYLVTNVSRLYPISAKIQMYNDAIGWIDQTFVYIRVDNLRRAFFAESQTGERTAMRALRDRGLVLPGGEASSLQFRMPPSVSPDRERVYRLRLDGLELSFEDLACLRLREMAFGRESWISP